MARQTARHAGSVESFLNRFGARLQALAASHDLLVRESWYGASVNELIRSQLAMYLDREDEQVAIDGPAVALKPEAAQNLGLALHELAVNAAKFGALSVPGGRLSITWDRREHDGDQALELDWREQFGPRVKPRRKRGFGSMVIERNLARALDAEVELEFRSGRLALPRRHSRQPDPRRRAEGARNLILPPAVLVDERDSIIATNEGRRSAPCAALLHIVWRAFWWRSRLVPSRRSCRCRPVERAARDAWRRGRAMGRSQRQGRPSRSQHAPSFEKQRTASSRGTRSCPAASRCSARWWHRERARQFRRPLHRLRRKPEINRAARRLTGFCAQRDARPWNFAGGGRWLDERSQQRGRARCLSL